ncbi:MAG: alanine racemase [Candidatus Atribacteria bacterium]|nr:alanine racemase [Candidatus Atribacteria bacterium]
MKELLGSAWLEIDLDAVKENVQNIRNWIGAQRKIMGIVKGNAYGHDAIEISKIILEHGADELAVAKIEEGLFLRRNNIKAPILVLGAPLKEQFNLYFDNQLKPTVCDLESIYRFNDIAAKLQQKIKIHLKIDTGMARLGLSVSEIKDILSNIKRMPNIIIEGVYTHFSTSDEKDKEYTYYQFRLFQRIIDLMIDSITPKPYFHAANSGAILDLPETWLDMVRPGCLIYGLYPSNEVKKNITLTPALSFKSRIAFLKVVPAESFIGYGKTFYTKRETVIATLPVGYADGYDRWLSNQGEVLIRGEKAPVIGRVCMDQMMIDVTGLGSMEVGDEVVLWGKQGGKTISVEDIAQKLNTIIDVIIHLTDKARVTKLFLKDGKPWKIKNMLGEYYCA